MKSARGESIRRTCAGSGGAVSAWNGCFLLMLKSRFGESSGVRIAWSGCSFPALVCRSFASLATTGALQACQMTHLPAGATHATAKEQAMRMCRREPKGTCSHRHLPSQAHRHNCSFTVPMYVQRSSDSPTNMTPTWRIRGIRFGAFLVAEESG